MPPRFICQHAREGKLKIVHLSRHDGKVSEHWYFSVKPSTIKRAFSEDDLWNITEHEDGSIRLTPAPRAGTNGARRA